MTTTPPTLYLMPARKVEPAVAGAWRAMLLRVWRGVPLRWGAQCVFGSRPPTLAVWGSWIERRAKAEANHWIAETQDQLISVDWEPRGAWNGLRVRCQRRMAAAVRRELPERELVSYAVPRLERGSGAVRDARWCAEVYAGQRGSETARQGKRISDLRSITPHPTPHTPHSYVSPSLYWHEAQRAPVPLDSAAEFAAGVVGLGLAPFVSPLWRGKLAAMPAELVQAQVAELARGRVGAVIDWMDMGGSLAESERGQRRLAGAWRETFA